MNEQKLKILTREEAIDLLDNQIEYTFQLQQENQKLHNKIDKTIEYINEFPLIHYSSIEKIEGKRLSGKLVPVDDLLEILRGSDLDE